MARTKHTEPRRLRAPRRVWAPFAPRGTGDASLERGLARALKELGLRPEPARRPDVEPAPLPRVIVRRPRSGFVHPADRADVRRLLELLGAACTYGLCTVELAQGGGEGRLGTLVVPGKIILYDQRPSPWRLPGALAAGESERLRRSGALVEPAGDGTQTIVTWPGETLRDFLLFDVLLHEIGHHLLQHDKGKRRERIARTADHEAFAERFATRCRALFGPGRKGDS